MILRVRWGFLAKLDDLTVGNRCLHLVIVSAVYDSCVPEVILHMNEYTNKRYTIVNVNHRRSVSYDFHI